MSLIQKDSFLKNISSIFVLLAFLGFIFLYQYGYDGKVETNKTETPIVQRQEEINIGTEPTIDITEDLEIIGRAESSFSGGTEGRNNNIRLGVGRIDGTVVMPGEEFSFKEFLGTTTPEDGFSVERIFLNGEVTKGIGGGLCQVSTLLFRVALDSGLPVTERANHSYSVSYYDVGLDATYSDPGPDL
ncbi:MAG: VanW family protein, partial [Minisyncoccia bacterium]